MTNPILLEKNYPTFKSFHGLVHADLIPAAIAGKTLKTISISLYTSIALAKSGGSNDDDEQTALLVSRFLLDMIISGVVVCCFFAATCEQGHAFACKSWILGA
jgi:hypothetical protein